MNEKAYEGWAIVEIMGHRRHVGIVREVVQFGVTMLRVDAVVGSNIDERRTYDYGGSAIFAIHRLTEEEAKREITPRNWGAPTLPLLPVVSCGKEEEEEECT